MAESLIVIGGTAAGLSAASKAKRLRPDMEVTVYERSGFVSYGALSGSRRSSSPSLRIPSGKNGTSPPISTTRSPPSAGRRSWWRSPILTLARASPNTMIS